MASIDSLMGFLENSREEFFRYEKMLDDLYAGAEGFRNLGILRKEKLTAKGSADHDRGKIVIGDLTGTMSGREFYDLLLEKYGICAEMATKRYVVLMTSVADTKQGFERLGDALRDIDDHIIPAGGAEKKDGTEIRSSFPVMGFYENNMKDALFARAELVPAKQAAGRIARDMITVYPPGIPVTIPGLEISADAVDTITDAEENGLEITGLEDGKVAVIWERSST